MNKLLLEQAITEYRIKHIIDTPHLKAKYLAEYKRENGSNALDEGFIDSLRDKFSSAATKVKNVAKGVADIGFLGRGTTIFDGSETFDIEKRKKMLDVATASLEMELKAISKWSETKDYGVELTKLYEYLKNTKFPNSDSFKTDVAMIKKKYDNIIENFNNNKIEAREANIIIAVLRHLVIFYQDYKIHDKYLYLNEAAYRKDLGNGSFTEYIDGRNEGDVSASYEAAYSTKLPAALIIGGASLLALGIGADSDIFQNLLERFKDMSNATPDQISKTISNVLVVKKGEGITQVMSRMSGIDLGPSAKLSALLNPKLKAIFPLIRMAVEFKNPGSGGKAFDQLIQLAGTNGNQTLGQSLQGDFSGTGKSIGDLLDVDQGGYTEAITKIVKGKAAEPLDTLKNKFLSSIGKLAGPILTGLGFAVAAGGVASGAMRLKGKLSSRMATLKALVDTFKDLGAAKDKVEKLPAVPVKAKQGAQPPPLPPPLPPEGNKGAQPPPLPPPLPPEGNKGAQPPPLPPPLPPEGKQAPKTTQPSGNSEKENKRSEIKIPKTVYLLNKDNVEHKKALEGFKDILTSIPVALLPNEKAQEIMNDVSKALGNGYYNKLNIKEQKGEKELDLTSILAKHGIIGTKFLSLRKRIQQWASENSNLITYNMNSSKVPTNINQNNNTQPTPANKPNEKQQKMDKYFNKLLKYSYVKNSKQDKSFFVGILEDNKLVNARHIYDVDPQKDLDMVPELIKAIWNDTGDRKDHVLTKQEAEGIQHFKDYPDKDKLKQFFENVVKEKNLQESLLKRWKLLANIKQ